SVPSRRTRLRRFLSCLTQALVKLSVMVGLSLSLNPFVKVAGLGFCHTTKGSGLNRFFSPQMNTNAVVNSDWACSILTYYGKLVIQESVL
ncbi:MAG: hypothetical protein AB2604_09985, partial [Candidatus Thiodiazotropha taylori]